MTREPERMEIADKPDLARVADEVCASHEPIVLVRDGEEVAMVVPMGRDRDRPDQATKDWEAFRSSFGAWADLDFDAEAFLAAMRQSRDVPGRPPVQL